MPPQTTNLDAALDYRERGWALLPLAPGDKRPHGRVLQEIHGTGWSDLAQRPASAPEIRAWFEVDPTAGLGILTGTPSEGLVVADVDKVARFTSRHPATPTAKTGRGWHLYFRAGSNVRTRLMSWGHIKGDGGYVVAPPSLHPTGPTYEWAIGPDDIELADFQELALEDEPLSSTAEGLPLVRDISDCGAPPRGEAQATGDQLATIESAVVAALPVLGISAPLRSGFRCVLPGHSDRKPSASLWPLDGVWKYSDWHERDGRRWLTLAEVRAAQVAGRVLSPFRGPLTATWYRRLFHEAGLRDLAPVDLPRLLPGTPVHVERAHRGFELLLAIREVSEPGVGTPFTRQFAADWCGLSVDQARSAIEELVRQAVIEKVGKHGRMYLYRPGNGPTTPLVRTTSKRS